MTKRVVLLAGLWLCLSPLTASAGDYSGEWRYQALNPGDTNFQVEHKGVRITFYRVLYPEFEGSHYKLEHMYRGRLSGNKIEGKMFVREEGMQDFELLRPFGGTIQGDHRMILDDMPLKRLSGAPAPKPATPTEDPTYRKVIIRRNKKEEETQAASPSHPAPKIPELIPVSRKIKTGKGRKVEALLRKGDSFYDQKRYPEAMEYFEAAWKLNPHKVEVLYKLGLGHGILASLAARRGQTQDADRHYRKAIRFWERALRYDPYNSGARENIRRAEKKLESLGG